MFSINEQIVTADVSTARPPAEEVKASALSKLLIFSVNDDWFGTFKSKSTEFYLANIYLPSLLRQYLSRISKSLKS